jgi:hypothetical protein
MIKAWFNMICSDISGASPEVIRQIGWFLFLKEKQCRLLGPIGNHWIKDSLVPA